MINSIDTYTSDSIFIDLISITPENMDNYVLIFWKYLSIISKDSLFPPFQFWYIPQ